MVKTHPKMANSTADLTSRNHRPLRLVLLLRLDPVRSDLLSLTKLIVLIIFSFLEAIYFFRVWFSMFPHVELKIVRLLCLWPSVLVPDARGRNSVFCPSHDLLVSRSSASLVVFFERHTNRYGFSPSHCSYSFLNSRRHCRSVLSPSLSFVGMIFLSLWYDFILNPSFDTICWRDKFLNYA